MDSYDKQYGVESELFGAPYPEFVTFVREHVPSNGRALDIGCGQGRDALMLAKHGCAVVGVDSSAVGIEQMVARSQADKTAVSGVVADFYSYEPEGLFDVIVLDSIIHFGTAERDKELAMLDRLAGCLAPSGYLCVFVHKSAQKEKQLHKWHEGQSDSLTVVQTGYLDYVYQEQTTDFSAAFQYYMLILQQA